MRLGFIRKVYLILSVQLIVTAIFVAISCFNDKYIRFVYENKWLIFVCLAVNLICMYTLIYVRKVARAVPWNYLLLFLFTITEAYMVSAITTQYDPTTVFIAAVLTAAVVIALTIYACTTKTDFTVCGGLLFAACMVLFVGSIIGIFYKNKIYQIILAAVAVLIFSIYLVYDTQLIMGNKENKFSIDDYIVAAMMLYIDIIRLFLEILKLVAMARNN